MNYVLLLCTDNVVDKFYIKIDDTTVVDSVYTDAFRRAEIKY